jgi:hypothetical protein
LALLGFSEPPDDFGLTMPPDITIARKRCQDVLVAKILAPRLVLLRRLADLPAEKRQCLTEAVRVKVRQARRRKSQFENLPNGPCAALVFAVEASGLEMVIASDDDFCRREKGIVGPKVCSAANS